MSLIHETISHEIAKELAPFWKRRTDALVTKNYAAQDVYILNPRGGRKPLNKFAESYPCPMLEDLFNELPSK